MKLDRSNTRRPWFQFSIKAVLILTLVTAAFAAGRLSEQRRAREAEQRARAEARMARMAAERSLAQAQAAQAAAQQLALQRARTTEPSSAVSNAAAESGTE